MAFKAPKRQPEAPGRAVYATGAPALPDQRVVHAEHGLGTLRYYEWLDNSGRWVQPLERDASDGHWWAIVTGDHRSFRCLLDELRPA